MKENNNAKSLLKIKDVSRILNVHSSTIRRWSDQGILKVYRINNRGDRRYKREDIINFLKEMNPFESDTISFDE